MKKKRDIEIVYTKKQFIEKLQRLLKALQENKKYRITINGVRISIPLDAKISIEHEKEGKYEELEFQLRWKSK